MEKKQRQKSSRKRKNEVFSERLDDLLFTRGIQNQELAWSIYVSPSTVSGWRTGYRMPDVYQIVLISSVLRVSSDYLLGISDDASEIIPKTPIELKKKK
ncbi:MAG: helix-turn-helix domain-containing protein [Agathobacter sp.]